MTLYRIGYHCVPTKVSGSRSVLSLDKDLQSVLEGLEVHQVPWKEYGSVAARPRVGRPRRSPMVTNRDYKEVLRHFDELRG